MEENTVTAADISRKIERYKQNRKLPPIKDYDKQYEPEQHKIFKDLYNYPDRWVETDVWNDEKKEYEQIKKIVPLVRVGLPYQKKIVGMAAVFFCGIPIKYSNDLDANEDFVNSFNKVIQRNKTQFIDPEIFTAVGRWTECAELWYNLAEDKPFDDYGFQTNLSLRVKILTPDDHSLYPIFDENDNLVRFSFQYEKADVDTGKKIQVFKSYTAKTFEHYEKERGNDWTLKASTESPIDKIPIVYYRQTDVEWKDVQSAIERLEGIYSNNGESNDRFAFPILKISGKVTGQLTKDRSGKVLNLEGVGADAGFVTPTGANENLTAEVDRLERDVHDFTSTPNISFDNMEGLGNVLSGAAAKFMFLQAHLKVKDKMKIYVPAFERRVSIIKSFLQGMNPAFAKESLALTPIVTPYVIDDDVEFFKMLMEINGGEPIISQAESMRRAGIKDPDAMITAINDENQVRLELENSMQPNPSDNEQ